MVRLQQDIVDYRAELKISRTHTPAVSTRYWDSVQTTVEASAPTPEVPAVEKLLQRLVTGTPEVPAVEKLLQRLVTGDWDSVQTTVEAPAPTPEVPAVEKLLQRLVTDTHESPSADGIITVDASIPRGTAPAPAIAPASGTGDGDSHAVDKWLQPLGTKTQSCPPPASTELEQLMCSFIAGQRRRRRPPRRRRRRDWSDVLCFSCGKLGHAATRCPNLNDSFRFMQPGWQTEKTPDGFMMIPPRVAMDRRRAENGG